MKILSVSSYYPPHVGGLEVVAEKQARSLVQHGHTVSVVTYAHTKELSGTVKVDEDGVTVHRVWGVHFFDTHFGIPFPFGGFGIIQALWREVQSADAVHIHDVFYTSSWIAYVFARIYKKPIILTQHVGMVEHTSRLVMLVQRIVYATWGALLFRNSKNIIVYNKNVLSFLKLHKVDLTKVLELKNGIDLSVFHPAPSLLIRNDIRQLFRLPLDRPLALFVGRFVPKKGFDKVFEARDSEYDLVFVGTGTIDPEWQKVAGVHFLGALDHTQLAKVYRAADFFVFPSQGELFTLVMQEAMASGLPVITTDDPAYRLYDLDRDCIAFCEPTIEELRRQMKCLANDVLLREQMSTYSLELARRWFDWDKNIQPIIDIYSAIEHNSRPHLMVVSPYFFPKIGGLENYAHNVARLLHTSGTYRVSIMTTNLASYAYKKEYIDGMTVHRLPILFKLSNTPINPLWYWYMYRIFRAEKPDMIHAHTPVPYFADVAERVRGEVPFVLTYHNDLVKPGLLMGAIAKLAYYFGINKTLRRADRVVATSQYYIDHSVYLKKFLRKQKNKLSIIPPGVNVDIFHTSIDSTWLKQTYGNRYTILFVGQLHKQHSHKGVPVLFEAASKLGGLGHDLNVVLVGTGDAIEGYKAHAKKLGLEHVFFAGRVSDDELAKYYVGADVTVLPSTTSSEGFGMVLLESNACGTPVIGSNIGGISQAVENEETGLLVTPNDAASLTGAIKRLINNPTEAHLMGRAGAVRVRELFGWEIQSKKYKKLFDSLLSESKENKQKKVLVTTSWDDGHVSDIKLASLLSKYGIKGTFYISPASREIANENRLSKEQIKTLAKDFEIGAHTMTHPHLSKISDEAAKKEIVDSKKYLEEITGQPVVSFCYPSGDFRKNHERMVHDAGFSLARTVRRFAFHVGINPYTLPTTIHTYRHWSDIIPIFMHSGLRRFFSNYTQWDTLAISLFEKSYAEGGVFHLWGHSWELEERGEWDKLERVLKHIASHQDVVYVTNGELV